MDFSKLDFNGISFDEKEKVFIERTGKDFTFFYKKYYPKLVYFTKNFCEDQQMAEDLTEFSFIKALYDIDKYEKDKSQFSTWLFTCARNVVIQEISKNKTVSMDNEVDEEGTTMKDFIHHEDYDYSSEKTLEYEKAQIIKNKINELKEPYKTVITLRELQNMSYKDIADNRGKDVEVSIDVDSDQLYKLPFEFSKVYSVKDELGIDHEFIFSDHQLNSETFEIEFLAKNPKVTPFYTHVNIKSGKWLIQGREPKKLSTIKSQIKNGRTLLINQTKEDFDKLDKIWEQRFVYVV
jgi:RNA polymerase sigma factor (sigma-70 family)